METVTNKEQSVAIVTGAGQGIGRAIAQRLSGDGMLVVIAELDDEAGREAEAEINNSRFIQTDVSDEFSVKEMIDETLKKIGPPRFLINNAGFMIRKHVTELTIEEWNRVIGTNLTGAFICAKHATPHLTAQKGAIVNIASTRALMSEPDTESYSASKGGIVALSHALAVSLGPNVRVNCISPGWINVSGLKKSSSRIQGNLTEADHAQHPAGRVGRPEDIASLTAYLLSHEAGFITGQNFVVDGGMTKKMIYEE